MEKYEFLEHPAELKIRSFGHDLAELFTNSALAMTDYLYELNSGKPSHKDTIKLAANDIEVLLVDWLAEILYLSAVNKHAYIDYNIENISDTSITAVVGAVPASAKAEIKAVTYHELVVKKTDDIWQATVVYDI